MVHCPAPENLKTSQDAFPRNDQLVHWSSTDLESCESHGVAHAGPQVDDGLVANGVTAVGGLGLFHLAVRCLIIKITIQ